MIEIIEEIEEFAVEMSSALAKFEKDELSLETLTGIHTQVENLFDTIRMNGVCRADIEVLNKLGLLEEEAKYYSVSRTLIGSDVALEAEGAADYMTIVIGVVFMALIGILSFFVGKLLAWIFSSTSKLSGASGSAQSGTKVKVTKGAEPLPVDLLRMGKGKGYGNVVALHALGDDYLMGKNLRVLFEAAEDGLKELYDRSVDLSTKTGVADELSKIIGELDISSVTDKPEINKLLVPSNLTTDLVKSTYAIIEEVCGEHLDKTVAKAATGDPLERNSIAAKSQRVAGLGGELYASKLTKDQNISLRMDPTDLDTKISESEQKTLEAEVKKFEAQTKGQSNAQGNSKRTLKLLNANAKSKDAKDTVKRYINYQLTFPAQYITKLVSHVLGGLLKSHVAYRALQVKFQKQYSNVFHEAELVKILKIIDSAVKDDNVASALKADIGKTRGEEITKSAEIIAEVLAKLEKLGGEVTKQLDGVKFYQKAKGKLNLRSDKLTSILTEED